MRRPHAAAAAAAAVALLLWFAVLTFAFHGCGSRFPGCGGLALVRQNSASLPRKMLLDVTSLDVSPSTADHQDQQRHHHRQHHHHHHHHNRHHHAQWNRQGIPPSAATGKAGDEVDPRYGVQKRLVPTGPNPLHH